MSLSMVNTRISSIFIALSKPSTSISFYIIHTSLINQAEFEFLTPIQTGCG